MAKSVVIEMTGLVFSRLRVVERAGNSADKKALWLCECECGKRTKVRSTDLRSRRTKSCGCWARDAAALRTKGRAAVVNRLYGKYKDGAHTRGIEFSLSKDQFESVASQSCHYCGAMPEPKGMRKKRVHEEPFLANGVDRKDNTVGYIIDNCLPCCTQCNMYKREKGYEEFTAWLDRAAAFRRIP